MHEKCPPAFAGGHIAHMGKLHAEVTLCVVGGDILHHLAQGVHVGGILAVLDPGADQVAHNAAEILSTGLVGKS